MGARAGEAGVQNVRCRQVQRHTAHSEGAGHRPRRKTTWAATGRKQAPRERG